MSKSSRALVAALLALVASAGGATLPTGVPACGRGLAMTVRVTGFRVRTGVLVVKAYDNPATFFDKGAYLGRVQVKVPAAGAAEVCMPVPHPGAYAVLVKHDVTGTGETDRGDGAGMSGNPRVSLLDVVFKRKPDPATVSVEVRGPTLVPVVLNYLQGGAFKPITTASR